MGEPQTAKLAKVLLMTICCAAAGYLFRTNLQLTYARDDAVLRAAIAQLPDPVAQAQTREIEAIEDELRNMSKSSSQASRLAMLAEARGKYPLDVPASLTDPFSAPVAEFTFEPDPPFVRVTAVMITDFDRIALLNVDGEEGIMVRQGAVFSDGRARITRIDEKGVTFSWIGKDYRASL